MADSNTSAAANSPEKVSGRPITPAPWSHVALAVLPGLLIMASATAAGRLPALRVVAIGIIALMGAAALALALSRRSAAAFPAWGLTPLGIIAFVVSNWAVSALFADRAIAAALVGPALPLVALLVVVWRERPGRPPAASLWLLLAGVLAGAAHLALLGRVPEPAYLSGWLFLAPAFAAGLLLAPAHGPRAVLPLLPAGLFMMSFNVEHVIYFWDAPRWSLALSLIMPLLFLVVIPAWVLRARSLRMAAVGLLVPPAFFYLLLAVGLMTASAVAGNRDAIVAIAQPVVMLFAILAVSGAIFIWLWRGGRQAAAINAIRPDGPTLVEDLTGGRRKAL